LSVAISGTLACVARIESARNTAMTAFDQPCCARLPRPGTRLRVNSGAIARHTLDRIISPESTTAAMTSPTTQPGSSAMATARNTKSGRGTAMPWRCAK
jgi:hypothetical protein